MSIRSLTDLAIKRDLAEPGTPVPSTSAGRTSEGPGDALISAIPAEIIALYTAITGGSLAVFIRNSAEAYLPYRWLLLAFAVIMTPVAVFAGYRRKYAAERQKELEKHLLRESPRTPVLEMVAATLAAAGWFLSAPGSPLLAMLPADLGLMAGTTIPLVTGAVLGVGFGTPLRRGSTLTPKVPASGANVGVAAGHALPGRVGAVRTPSGPKGRNAVE